MCSTVDNVSSNTTCYWGEIFPVMTFNIKATDLVWNGYFQRDNPVFYLGPHLGITDRPPCMGDSRTNTCQPQVWYPVGQIWNSTPATFFSGVFSYSSIYRLFYLWHAGFNNKGNIMVLTAYVHSLLELRRKVRLSRINSLILCSTIEFWCWYPTPD